MKPAHAAAVESTHSPSAVESTHTAAAMAASAPLSKGRWRAGKHRDRTACSHQHS